MKSVSISLKKVSFTYCIFMENLMNRWVKLTGFFGLTSWSIIFQSFWDGAIASWVFTSTLGSLKCLAQGHYTMVMGF